MATAIPIRGKGMPREGQTSKIPASTWLCYSPNVTRSMPAAYRDEPDIFNLERQQIKLWLMDEGMWAALPRDMYKAISRVQHAGAAVLGGLDRLEQLVKDLPKDEEVVGPISLGDPAAGDVIAAKLQEHVAVLNARPNRPKPLGPQYNCSPIPTSVRKRQMSSYLGSFTSSRSPISSGTNSTGYMSPVSPAVGACPPSMTSPPPGVFAMSPSLTPLEELPNEMNRRDSQIAAVRTRLTRRDSEVLSTITRSTNGSRGSKSLKLKAPKDYKSTVYYGELESIRQKELVRLRHSQRPLRLLYAELKETEPLSSNPELRDRYEAWWKETEEKIKALDAHIKDLCEGIHFSLGWADIPGLDNKYNHLDAAHLPDDALAEEPASEQPGPAKPIAAKKPTSI